MVREETDTKPGTAPAAVAVRLDVALQGEEGEQPKAAAAASTTAISAGGGRRRARKPVVRDLDEEDEEDLPDVSRLSISAGPNPNTSRQGSSHVNAPIATSDDDGPVASRTRAREQSSRAAEGRGAAGGRGTPAAATRRAPAGTRGSAAASPSPTLSRYGVTLDYEPPPEQEVLAHALLLTGFPPPDGDGKEDEGEGGKHHAREELVRPWMEIGALISWLPADEGAVAMFCSVPTAQRAARKVPSGPHGVRAAPLVACPSDVQQRALGLGLVIPPRPKADTAVSSRLICGALGLRSPGSSRPPIAGSSAAKRSPVTRSQTAEEEEEQKEGSRGGDRGRPKEGLPLPPQPPSARRPARGGGK